QLARQINEEHGQAEEELRSGILHARSAGEILLRVKDRLQHGEWLPWVRANLQFSERTAQNYMRIARRWEELEANPQRAADLSYREGVQLLSKKQEPEPDPAEDEPVPNPTPRPRKTFLEMDPADRHDLVSKWSDQQAAYALLLDAAGRTR